MPVSLWPGTCTDGYLAIRISKLAESRLTEKSDVAITPADDAISMLGQLAQ